MKTCIYLGAVIAATLSVSAVNAQVLGGNATGALGGTLSGGMRDMNVVTRGNGTGSFGADLDTGSLRRTTSDVSGRAANRVRNSADNSADRVRGRTQSTLGDVRAKGEAAATTTASAAANGVNGAAGAARQIDATANAAGSLASDVNVAGNEAAGTFNGAHQQQLLAAAAIDSDAASPTQTGVGRAALTQVADANAKSEVGQLANRSDASDVSEGSTGNASSKPLMPANGSLTGALEHGASAESSTGNSSTPIASGIEGSGDGSATGSAAASKQGVSANVSAEANGSGNASLHR